MVFLTSFFFYGEQEDWVLCRVFYKNRGMSAKCQENSYDDTGSSSPPPLLDSFLTFDQPSLNGDGFEQVPCFSNFSQNNTSQQTNQTFLVDLPQVETDIPTSSLFQLGALPDLGAFVNPFSCEKKVIKAVLDHISKLEGNQKLGSSGYGEGSSGSYLSQVGFPNIWNHY